MKNFWLQYLNLKKNNLIFNMSFSAMMIALGVILSRFVSLNTTYFRIGFGSLPVALTSILLGPIWGGLVGASYDLLASFIFPLGAYFPGYTIDAFLQGVIPSLVLLLVKGNKFKETIYFIIFSFLICLYVTCFTSLFDTFKKIELPLYARILIPFGFLLYFFAIYFINYLLEKQNKIIKTYKKYEKGLSFFEIYLCSMTGLVLISMSLLPIWNLMVVKIPFLVTSFTQGIIFLGSSIVRVTILYILVNAAYKIVPQKVISYS